MDAEFWGILIGAAAGSFLAVWKGSKVAGKAVGDAVVKGTASQSTSDEIRDDVKEMKLDIALLKKREIERHGPCKDDRSPKGDPDGKSV